MTARERELRRGAWASAIAAMDMLRYEWGDVNRARSKEYRHVRRFALMALRRARDADLKAKAARGAK